MKTVEEQLSVIKKRAVDLITEEELKAKLERFLRTGRPLRVKLGIDPTAPDIHLGHAVILTKLREFQELGHMAVLIIGDYTARIGDPSGRSELRPVLSGEVIDEHAKTYTEQVFKILLRERTEVRFNGEWLAKLRLEDVIRLASKFTVARLLERDDFEKRLKENKPVSLSEVLYPVMQAYDSVMVQADVELGGTEQKFNLLVGRDLQREFGQEPQVVMTMPILVGIDGVNRMSKSLGNYVGITESPSQMFGKLMSIPDEAMRDYLVLASTFTEEEVHNFLRLIEQGDNPSKVKRALAKNVVARFHGSEEAIRAEREFDRVFKEKGLPDEVADFSLDPKEARDGRIWVVRLLVLAGFAGSNSEAMRLIKGGAFKLDGKTWADVDAELDISEINGKIIQVGKRKFARVKLLS